MKLCVLPFFRILVNVNDSQIADIQAFVKAAYSLSCHSSWEILRLHHLSDFTLGSSTIFQSLNLGMQLPMDSSMEIKGSEVKNQ